MSVSPSPAATADAARRGRRAVAPAPLPGAGSATPPDPPPLARPAPERPRSMGARSRLRVVKGLHVAIVVVFLAGGFALLSVLAVRLPLTTQPAPHIFERRPGAPPGFALHISRRTVERLVANGDFPLPLKIGRSSRFLESNLASFLRDLRRHRAGD